MPSKIYEVEVAGIAAIGQRWRASLDAQRRSPRTIESYLAAVDAVATDAGCARIWLITTNDNVDALRFYQRRGYRLLRVDAGAVDRSRSSLKPAIPLVGSHGIPIRDEIVLERRFGAAS